MSEIDGADEQDRAELLDDDVVSGDDVDPGAESDVLDPPEHSRGIQFADADVTDESFAERTAQEQPEVSPADIDERFADDEPPIASVDE